MLLAIFLGISVGGGDIVRWIVFALCFLPLFYVVVRFGFAVHAAVLEGCFPFEAFGRSRTLVATRMRKVVLVDLILVASGWAMLSASTYRANEVPGPLDLGIVAVAIALLMGAAGVVSTVLYHELAAGEPQS